MDISELTIMIADILKRYDEEQPAHNDYKPGIGPFTETKLVRKIADELSIREIPSEVKKTPDLDIREGIAVEFKITRPYGNNGKPAENWSVNLLHPYEGNESLIGDAIKLSKLPGYSQKVLFVIGYEHNPSKIGVYIRGYPTHRTTKTPKGG